MAHDVNSPALLYGKGSYCQDLEFLQIFPFLFIGGSLESP